MTILSMRNGRPEARADVEALLAVDRFGDPSPYELIPSESSAAELLEKLRRGPRNRRAEVDVTVEFHRYGSLSRRALGVE
jgi:hypothetical protein